MMSTDLFTRPRSVTLFCPDRHIRFDARMLDARGFGGGITSRVRLAAALARRGHRVEMVCNCEEPAVVRGVHYHPLDSIGVLEADLLIANTSGGEIDLRSLSAMDVRAGTKVLLVSGVTKPKGIEAVDPDVICAKSNFLRTEVRTSWGVHSIPIVVIYNGFVAPHFSARGSKPPKDPYRLIYASYPEKGLDGALRITERLQALDHRYHLRVLGSEQLWGQPEIARSSTDSVSFLGNVPQHRVAVELEMSTFSLCLQSIREGFGLTLLESLRAGCCVVASSVGAFPELIDHGVNGVLVEAAYGQEAAIDEAVAWITKLTQERDRCLMMQRAAQSVSLSWERIALAWEQFFLSSYATKDQVPPAVPRSVDRTCRECGSSLADFTDGYRCLSCGRYDPAESLHALAANAG